MIDRAIIASVVPEANFQFAAGCSAIIATAGRWLWATRGEIGAKPWSIGRKR